MRTLAPLFVAALAACSSQSSLQPLKEVAVHLESPTVLELTDDNRPIVQVHFGDQGSVPFLVDSGAESTLIAPASAERVGLRVGNYSGVGTIQGSGNVTAKVEKYAYIEEMRVGDLVVSDFYITALEDKSISEYGFHGVLGQDLLERLVVVFDMQNRELHLLPIGTDQARIETYLSETGLGIGTWTLEPTVFRPRPFLPMQVDGMDDEGAEVLIDTGADSTAFPTAVIEALELEHFETHIFNGIGGEYEGRTFQIEQFGLSGFFADFELHETPQDYGHLGMNLLGQFVFVLDAPGGNFWLHHREVEPR